MLKMKNRDHRYFRDKHKGVVHRVLNLRGNIPKESLVVLHNGSNYDYH